MTTLITNPSISDPVALPAGFFAERVGPREGIIVSDPEAAVSAQLSGLPLTVQTLDTGTGDVVGPGLSTDDALVRWDGVTGLLVQDSNAVLSDDVVLTLTRHNSGVAGPQYHMDHARGTEASPVALQTGDEIGSIVLGGYNGTAFIDSVFLTSVATEAWSSGDHGASFSLQVTANQSGASAERMFIDQDGATTFNSITGSGDVFSISGLAVTSGNVLRVSDTANDLETGHLALFESASTDDSNRDLVRINNTGNNSDGTSCLLLNSVNDLRSSLRLSNAGAAIEIAERSSAPTSVAGTGIFWVQSELNTNRGVFTEDNGVDRFVDTGYALSWGADFDAGSAGDFASANGEPDASHNASVSFLSALTAPRGGRARFLSWNTESADFTTVVKIHVVGFIGSVTTVALDGTDGVLAISPAPSVGPGDVVAIEFDAGTVPDRGTYVVIVE